MERQPGERSPAAAADPERPGQSGRRRAAPSKIADRGPRAAPPSRAEPTQRVGDGREQPRLAEALDHVEEHGVRKMPKSVTPSMPLNTAIPSDRRISAPAPAATTSGNTPRMKANEVIRIGRSRSRRRLQRRLEAAAGPPGAAAWRTRRSGSRSCTPGRPAPPGRSARRC